MRIFSAPLFAPTLLATTLLAAPFLATAGHAQTPTGYYVAVPAAPATQSDIITHTTPWHLQNGAYVAAQAPERHQVLCRLVAQRAGQLTSFSVRGKAYAADDLAKCNAKAKPATETAAR